MRPASWLLFLSLLLSASAQARSSGLAAQRRTLEVPSRPAEVPPQVLYVASNLATLVRFEAPLRREALRLPDGEARLQLVPMGEDSLVLLPSRPLAEDEQVSLTLELQPGAEPLRFLVVSRPDVVDQYVLLLPPRSSADEDAAESIARQLLAAPQARPTLSVPQKMGRSNLRDSRGEVESALWMGRRFFLTLSVRGQQEETHPWRLVQVRLRATLADGTLQEWPARLVSGAAGRKGQRHVLTGLIPEGAPRLELALDGADSPGEFHPLPIEAVEVLP